MLTLSICPLCGASVFKKYIEAVDHIVSHETFSIVQCESCNHLFTNPRPEEHNLGKYYESDEYISHSNSSKGLFNSAYQAVRKYTINKKVKLINSVSGGGRNLLDIGSGTGEFLNALKENGWKVQGLEPSEKACAFSKANYSLVVNDIFFISKLPDHSFDVITMWHVMEHVGNIHEMAAHLQRLLVPTGTLFVAVPNSNSCDSKIYKQHWAAWDVPRHLHHFSVDTVKWLFAARQMEVKKILPMYFDSFYVSMLSEKYKHGKMKLPEALFNGLKSNIAGSRDISAYSSLIFQIQNSNSK